MPLTAISIVEAGWALRFSVHFSFFFCPFPTRFSHYTTETIHDRAYDRQEQGTDQGHLL